MSVRFLIVAVGTVTTAALTAIAASQKKLGRKTAIAFGGQIVIPVLELIFFPEKTHITKIAFSYIVIMFVVVNKFLLSGKFDGVVLWPFIVIKRRELRKNRVFMNHERIHLRQQLELLLVLFFIFYLFEYLVRLICYRDTYKAYSSISFEKEAYVNERNLTYLRVRKPWSFIRYL